MGIRGPLFRGLISCLTVLAVMSMSHQASAQDDTRTSRLTYAVRGVITDPTTYAPALLSLDGMMRDWKTSQPFFQNGFVEKNARFTITGLPYDQALSYEAGRTQVLRDTLSVLEMSAVMNFGDRLLEHHLLQRFPSHRKLVKAVGWVERVSVASLMSYRLAGPHYRQWRLNESLTSQLSAR